MDANRSVWAVALRRMMTAKGWSQARAATALGSSQPTISRVLAGRKPRSELRKILENDGVAVPENDPVFAEIVKRVSQSPQLEALVRMIVSEMNRSE